ncbi:MAG: thioredoxin domain-containing protein [Patescibacteria group bacterium]
MAIEKRGKNTSSNLKVKSKVSVRSTKLLVGISILSLMGFVLIFLFGLSIFRDSASKSSESKSNFSFVKRGVVANDTFVPVNSSVPEALDTDPTIGKKDAKLTIFEYGDFGCAHCASMNTTMKKIVAEYPDTVQLVWKDYPTASSVDAAMAGRCAQIQDKFWEMHDLLFENSFFLNKGRFSDLAQDLGLDVEKFDTCVDSGTTALLVQESIDQAAGFEIDGTPYYFINDQEISGTIGYDDLKNIIESELVK